MRPTLEYLKDKFEYYNRLCFDGSLPMPSIKLNMRYSEMGVTKYREMISADGVKHYGDFSIEISVRRDLPEEEYIDTLVHEMIHYYIAYNHIVDDSTHGQVFCQKMKYITDTFGIKISIAFDADDEYLVNTVSRIRYVCVAEFDDGRMGLSVVAKNKIFALWKQMPQIEGVRSVWWYVTNRAIFDKYPVMVSPALIITDADKIHHYLTGAYLLENDGKVIKVKD